MSQAYSNPDIMNETPFQKDLKKQIKECIRSLREDGTVAMSAENLMQCLRVPRVDLEGSPRGPGARLQYEILFLEICQSSKDIKSFLL